MKKLITEIIRGILEQPQSKELLDALRTVEAASNTTEGHVISILAINLYFLGLRRGVNEGFKQAYKLSKGVMI